MPRRESRHFDFQNDGVPNMRPYPLALTGGSFDCRFAIADLSNSVTLIRNLQSALRNQETHPLPRGGTDLTPL
jgi:hypothetical protein